MVEAMSGRERWNALDFLKAAAIVAVVITHAGPDTVGRVGDDLVWARAHELAGEMGELVPEAITMTKRLLNETLGESLSTEISVGAALMATARTTESAQQALEKWLAVRNP